jgi:hypothetical protein
MEVTARDDRENWIGVSDGEYPQDGLSDAPRIRLGVRILGAEPVTGKRLWSG